MTDALFEDPALVQFYDLENGLMDDTRFCLSLAFGKASVLDLGCGTGLLAAALGEGREVFGVDPAAAMLDVARRRAGGQRVTWVEADARTVRLGRRFDLIVMTGHAFQVLLTDDDQRAVCETIAAHLVPGGIFIFDSRNPAAEEWREWTPAASRRAFDHPGLGRITAWNDVAHDPATEVVTYQTVYQSESGEEWRASSRIRFAGREAIAARIVEAGLRVDRWLGDWKGKSFAEGDAEMIPVGSLAVRTA
jgi:SAM-dependent methyltransferase